MAEPYVGQIQAFGFSFAPRGWARCEGQLLAISSNDALFSLLGTIYGGDGRQTFALPDLRGRASMQFGSGPGLTARTIGQKSGQESVTLTTQHIAAHHHAVTPGAATTDGGSSSPQNNFPATVAGSYASGSNVSMGNTESGLTGGNGSHNNMQPYIAINWCISLIGIYPSRS